MPYLGSSPPENALEAGDIASNAVTTAKIANDAVDIDKINLVSTSSAPSLEAKGTSGQTEGYIQLNCAENSHGIKLKSPPHSAGQSYTLTFPSAIVDGGFMKTDSSGNLSFAASGGLQHITTVTASDSASLDVNSTFSSTYLNYLVVLTNIVPASNNVSMNMLFSANNGSSYITSNYQYVLKHFYVGPSGDGNSESTGTSPQLLATSCNNTAADAGTNGIISIYSPISDAMRTTYVWDFKSRVGDGSNSHQRLVGAGECGGDLDTNAFQISFASGNVASGTLRVYGIINS